MLHGLRLQELSLSGTVDSRDSSLLDEEAAEGRFDQVDDPVDGAAHDEQGSAGSRVDDIIVHELDGPFDIGDLNRESRIREGSGEEDGDDEAEHADHEPAAVVLYHDVALGDRSPSSGPTAPGIPVGIEEVARSEDDDVAAAIKTGVLQRIRHIELFTASLLVVGEPLLHVLLVG